MIPGLGRAPREGNSYPPVFLPEEFHGQRSLGGYNPWGRKELDMTEPLTLCHGRMEECNKVHVSKGSADLKRECGSCQRTCKVITNMLHICVSSLIAHG